MFSLALSITALRVLPSQQRLGALNLSGGDVNLGLKEQPELVPGKRPVQFAFEAQLSGGMRLAVTGVDLVTAASQLLRPGVGDGRVAQQCLNVSGLLGEDHDADARGDNQLAVIPGHRLRNHLPDTFGGLVYVFVVSHAGQQNHKLVSPDTGGADIRAASRRRRGAYLCAMRSR